MERLDRGLVAVKTGQGVYVGWRKLGTDPEHVEFDLYRNGKKVNPKPSHVKVSPALGVRQQGPR
ncbi:hypothetical protein [Paenibacillus mucilaginosus]|uniref:rhamnogalacturonan endolyase family protein n=1 Tax=Paenibacillus mucilaginosus TaxID=61624 RepID=UPI0013E8D137|nr:hypothetical protein KCX80_18395 [Paenibacillus mucilaginosus]